MSRAMNQPERYSQWFVIIVALFVTALVIANIIAVKLISIGSLVVPAGVVVFPLSYIFGDVLTEVYGYTQARKVIWLGFFCNLLAVIAIAIGQVLPSAPIGDIQIQRAYERILGYAPRLLAASFLAYLFGEFANSFVLARMKLLTRGRYLWTRTIGSTLIGEGLDSAVFITIAFAGNIPQDSLLNAVLIQWLFKSAYEIIATPLTYFIVNSLKRIEGIDTFDYKTNFNPARW